MMDTFLHDLRFAAKLLLKDKAFNVVALLTLALCIGANTAIFSVINSVLLRPLPYPESERLVTLYNSYPGVGAVKGANGAPDYMDRKQATDIFEELSIYNGRSFNVGAEGSPQRVRAVAVTPSFFRVLQVSPQLGRPFTEEEGVRGQDKVVILSHGLWQELFGGNPNAIGQDLRLSGRPYRVVGVMRESFDYQSWNADIMTRGARMWVPQSFTDRQLSDDARHSNQWDMIGRLQPGVSVAQAQSKIDAINTRNAELYPKYKDLLKAAGFHTPVVGLHDEMVEGIRPTLLLLQAAVAFVLLIGCVNVANLLLVRSNVRMKELSIRAAMGAGRTRLTRLLLTESVLLGILGGALGLVVGIAGVRLLGYLGADQIPRGEGIGIDINVLGFTFAVAVVTGLFFGFIPVVHVLRANLAKIFRQTGRSGTAERPALLTRAILVVAQVSLAFVLLIGAGLMILSLARVLAVNPGFQPEGVLTAQLTLPFNRYKENAQTRSFTARALEEIRALPGVKSAGMTSYLPFAGMANSSVIAVVGHTLAPGELPPVPGWSTIDTGYFRAMGIPLIKGRTFQETDTADAQRVVVIDEFLAKKYWPDQDPIGQQIRRGIEPEDPVLTVVGVVGSVKNNDLAGQSPVGVIYWHYKQFPTRGMSLVVKAERQEQQLVGPVRATILGIDPEQPLFDVKTMTERVEASLMTRKATVTLAVIFAGLAPLLSAIGIYGVLAYTVSQRTQEIGVRMALGASARAVIHSASMPGVKLAGIGLAIGLVGALFLTRLMTSQLYNVAPTEPSVFVLVSLVLAGVALLASVIPSLRATRIEPMNALRYE
ncbi:MAG: ABC transporter permease [bacterium]|nr:ABC transporter permease [bacterium]